MGTANDHLAGLTLLRLRWLLRYDAESGKFYWQRHDKKGRASDGSEAGTLAVRGYVKIHVDRRGYLAHRLAWFYVHGTWPPADIDHRNGVRDDNRLENLRPASRTENLGNARGRRDGLKGVYYRAESGKWVARIRRDGVVRYLGSYATEELAHKAYQTGAEMVYGEFAKFG